MAAGRLDTRVHCQKRTDGGTWGTPVAGGGAFEQQFSTMAQLTPLRGSETVIGERLAGRQPYVVRVYRNSNTRQITNSWRLVDANDPGRVFAVKSPTHDPDGSRAFLEFLVEEGGMS
jgi:head-tail adaptor